jgi:hypothetical protein
MTTAPLAIDKVLTDSRLLGSMLAPIETWATWTIALKAAFALPLTDDELQTFKIIAGNRGLPSKRVRELWVIAGRRGGKSRIAAALACYFALFVKHKLAPGERGMVLVLAATVEQARVVFGYVGAFLQGAAALEREIDAITADEIKLKNGIVIGVHPNSFRSIRGRTLCACIFDEVSFWRDDSTATPDSEVYTAVLPALLTTNGMLVGISSPYRRVGLRRGWARIWCVILAACTTTTATPFAACSPFFPSATAALCAVSPTRPTRTPRLLARTCRASLLA